MKTPIKQRTKIAEKETLKPGYNVQKGKEMVKVATSKQDTRTLMPRKSTKATPSNLTMETMKSAESRSQMAQAEPMKIRAEA